MILGVVAFIGSISLESVLNKIHKPISILLGRNATDCSLVVSDALINVFSFLFSTINGYLNMGCYLYSVRMSMIPTKKMYCLSILGIPFSQNS